MVILGGGMSELGWGQPPKQRVSRGNWWRSPLLVVVATLSFVAGFWFGGETGRGISMWAIAALAACVLLGDLLGSGTRRWARLSWALIAAVIFGAGWMLGLVELDRAFAACVERGEELRTALEEHREREGRYPEYLDELAPFAVPGNRLLRPGLMQYESSSETYTLRFADATVYMTATQDRGFFEREPRSPAGVGRDQ
jgi:hypothetical protein